ncbi:hypothetical protein ACQ4PT_006021 [Festuca glaucescens]
MGRRSESIRTWHRRWEEMLVGVSGTASSNEPTNCSVEAFSPSPNKKVSVVTVIGWAGQACMFETNRVGQSKISTMNESADGAVDLYRDTMKTSSHDRFAVLRSIGEEFIYEDELRLLLKRKSAPICYVWFEPSPMMDVEQGIMKTIYVNKMVKAGFTLVWLSDELNHHSVDYWPLAVEVSRKYTMNIMAGFCWNKAPYGPQRLPAGEIFYPCMQVAAILCQKLQADIWLFSMDHRDITMLARDYCEAINRENEPAIMLHNMLPNLLEDPDFQDLRDPGRTIFMHDEEDDLNRKIWRALCPPKVATCNPCLDYIKYVLFPWFGKLEVVQKEGNADNKTYTNMEELVVDYESGSLDSTDVKRAFQKAMNRILQVTITFSKNCTQSYVVTCASITC